jgi:cytochrome c oxidase cbb3-type subunit III
MDDHEREDLHNKNIRLMDHSYDGIQEFDQKLPNWWLFTLYGAIVFSVLFWVIRHQWMNDEYDFQKLETELAMVEEAKLEQTLQMLNDDTLYGFAQNPEWVDKGRETFMTNCISCHGADLKGGIGVNLTDSEWLHGGKPTEIFNTITNGVPLKGMQSWQGQLGPRQIAELVSFILSKQS